MRHDLVPSAAGTVSPSRFRPRPRTRGKERYEIEATRPVEAEALAYIESAGAVATVNVMGLTFIQLLADGDFPSGLTGGLDVHVQAGNSAQFGTYVTLGQETRCRKRRLMGM